VRIISATHQDLAACVESGKFRQDLYYRLNVIELKMPSLRNCREDIPLLANAILARLAKNAAIGAPQMAADAMEELAAYDFPGNVRELENILERAIALTGSEEISADDLRLAPAPPADEPAVEGAKWPLQDYLDRVEREAILEALQRTRFNRTAAARMLGITFRALRYRMERLGIN
jgi:two-component system response regulator PilR (NtrC family)